MLRWTKRQWELLADQLSALANLAAAALIFGQFVSGPIFLGKPRIGFHHLAGVDSLCSLDGKKGDPMAAYFVFTIGACLFAAAALAYDSYAERRERRAKKHHNR